MSTEQSVEGVDKTEGPQIQWLDDGILATQRAKNKRIQKIAVMTLGIAFSVFAVYQAGVYLSAEFSGTGGEVQQQSTPVSPEETDVKALARDKLQQMLVTAESAVAQLEQDPGRMAWNTSAINSLRNVLKLAYGSYSAENYHQATKQLAQLQNAVAEFEQGYGDAWQSAFAEARSAWQTRDIVRARLSNQQVIKINPTHVPAQELQARLNVWDIVSEKREALRVAQVENNLQKQLQIVSEIVSLDPQNQDMAQQLTELHLKLKNSRFSSAIAKARNLLADGDTEASASALEKARQIDAGRPEVAHLQAQLDDIADAQSEARLQQQIATMQSVDNWLAAQKLSETAKNKHPDNSQFQLSYKLASQILEYQQQLSAYLNAPVRLTDPNIRNNANGLLSQVSQIEVASVSLKQRADELRMVMKDSIQNVAVTVLSDGRTDIRVLGTGVVGKTKKKVIQLVPGSYRFEGRRKGYQSKVVAFTVEATDQPQSITLICDQKI